MLLISKKRDPRANCSRVPLRPARGVVIAHRVGTLAAPPAGSRAARQCRCAARALGRQVTAADLSPDGRTLAVLTYDRLLLYPRAPGEPGRSAVAPRPARSRCPGCTRPKRVAWLPDGKGLLIATGEFSPAPLVWLPATR